MTREEFIKKVSAFENALLSEEHNEAAKHLGDLLVVLDARIRFFEEEKEENRKAILKTLGEE